MRRGWDGRLVVVEEEEEEERADLCFVGPLVFELVQHVDIAKGAQKSTHKSRFTDRFLDAIEATANHRLGADDPSHRASYLSKHIISTRDSPLARRNRMRDLLGGLQPRINDRDRDHPDAMLHAGRQHGDFGEQTLVRGTGHDLVRVSLGAAIGPDDDDGGTEMLDEVPAGAGDGEDVDVVADVAQDLERGVVLEEQVHFDADPADVLEHVGELHVLRVGAEAVESGKSE